MGRAAAWDLARREGVETVALADREPAALALARAELGRARTRVETHPVNLEDELKLDAVLEGFDVALSAADYRYNEGLTRAAIRTGVHLCDLGGNPAVVARQLALSPEAEHAGVTVVPDCGLAPGLACWLAAWGVERLGQVHAVHIRVGGLPAHPKPPLNYKIVFSVRGLTNEYIEPALVLRDGKLLEVPSLTEPEPIEFAAPFGRLEAFHTAGGLSTLVNTLRGKVRHLDYKTIRYPGHCAAFQAMAKVGFFSEEQVGGVVPRELTERLLERALTDGDTDVVLVRVEIQPDSESSRRLVFEVVDHHDAETGHSAMARTTAYPVAVVAHCLGSGVIKRHGVLPAETCFPLAALVQAVRERGIDIRESWKD
jgi:lysine 6-dehydrogenase